MQRKLYKNPSNSVIAGVCSGLGNYFNIDVTLMRILFVAFALLGGPGILVYIVLAIIMKKPPSEYEMEREERF